MIETAILINEEANDLHIDVMRDSLGLIVSGIAIGDARFQNIKLIVESDKGDFKEFPTLGVGAEKYLKSVGRANDLRREIGVQLETIGYGKVDVRVSENGILEIDI